MAKRKPSETPLMRQYLEIKEHYPEAVLFFRCGDFYEMFFDDAVKAAAMLDIALTSRHKDSEEAIPMAGVPHHAARSYIARLTEMGQKVVLCEQAEDPKLAKGLVRREVVRVITPGVVLDDELLDPKSPRYLAAVACEGSAEESRYGLAYLDVSTGEFHATEMRSLDALVSELSRVRPREVLTGEDDNVPMRDRHGADKDRGGDRDGHKLDATLARLYRDTAYSSIVPATWHQAKELLESALAGSLGELGLGERPLALRAAADVIAYARATQPAGVLPLCRLHVYEPGETLVLDEAAIANLELTSTLMGGKREGSLLAVMDQTCTAPGGRLLRRWLLYPLTEIAPIRRRQDAVGFFVENPTLRRYVRDELRHIHDIERLSGRVLLGVATPRDLGRLRDSLARLPRLARLVAGQVEDTVPGTPVLHQAAAVVQVPDMAAIPDILALSPELLARLGSVRERLAQALVDEPGSLAKDGGFIRPGFCRVVDEQRRLSSGGKDEILAIENRERERTGIPSLKVKYNRVFGYYIEVTRSHLGRVPGDYVRKQTIAQGERYVTTELSELEARVLGAQELLLAREQELFTELCADVARVAELLAVAGQTVALIDCCASLAEVAHTHGYVRPEVDESQMLDIVDGRHPVVERMVPEGSFVPNDCRLDTESEQLLLITGPNMAGKSTYMRQVAQIVLLSQMGSFVPATRATIGLCDRIFTRVGAADNLARGESTFMVEMRETAAILHGATRRSLVVLDEVGRGTSTFDGISIAWAVTEYLHDAIRARTLFATHYHELCMLAETRPRVRNVSVAVKEHRGEIVFLRQVVAGGASRSYGIDVARLAGLPRSVIGRGKQILDELERGALIGQGSQLSLFTVAKAAPPAPVVEAGAPSQDRTAALLARLRAIDPHQTTPIQALALLAELCADVHELEPG